MIPFLSYLSALISVASTLRGVLKVCGFFAGGGLDPSHTHLHTHPLSLFLGGYQATVVCGFPYRYTQIKKRLQSFEK